MKYGIKIEVFHKDAAEVQLILDTLPISTDTKQWAAGHIKTEVLTGSDILGGVGNFVGLAKVFFNTKPDRDACVVDVKAIMTKAAAFETGSRIIQFDSSHYQDGEHVNALGPCAKTRADEIISKASGLEQKVL